MSGADMVSRGYRAVRVRVAKFDRLAEVKGDGETVVWPMLHALIPAGRAIFRLLYSGGKPKRGEIVESSNTSGWPRVTRWSCSIGHGTNMIEVIASYSRHPADGEGYDVEIKVPYERSLSLSAGNHLGYASLINISTWSGDTAILDRVVSILARTLGGAEVVECTPPRNDSGR